MNDKDFSISKIIKEIEKQYKWLLEAGINTYNVDIAFYAIKNLAEMEMKNR